MKLHFDEDLENLIAWCEDTLQPSIDLMQMKVTIREIIQEATDFIQSKGKSELSEFRLQRLEKLLDACNRLDTVAMQNNTFQLIVRHTQLRHKNALLKIQELEDKIQSIEKAWNQE